MAVVTGSARPEAEILSRRSRGRLGAGGRPRDACTIGIVDAGRGCAQSSHSSNRVSSRGSITPGESLRLYRALHSNPELDLEQPPRCRTLPCWFIIAGQQLLGEAAGRGSAEAQKDISQLNRRQVLLNNPKQRRNLTIEPLS